MPFCRDCGSEVEEDWVACPKCGELLSLTSSRENTTSEMTALKTMIINSKKTSAESKIAYMIIGLMLLLVIIPGEYDRSLLAWADESCRMEFDGVELVEYREICSEKKIKLFICVSILIACILYLNVDGKKKNEKKLKEENEKMKIDLEMEKNRAEKSMKLRKKKEKEKSKKRWAVRQNNPLRYNSILTIKAITIITFLTLLFLGIIGQNLDGKTRTNNYGIWGVDINGCVNCTSTWSGEVEVDGQRHSINGNGHEFSWYEGKEVFVEITKDAYLSGDQTPLCVSLSGPDYYSDIQCTYEQNGEILFPEQKPIVDWWIIVGIIAVATTSSIIIIEKKDRRKYHLSEVSSVEVTNTEVVDSQQNEETADLLETNSEYEQSDDGYWYIKKNDGTYEPTAHEKDEDGSFIPYSE